MAHKIIVTHSGTFHPDDLLACAVVKIIEERKGNTVEIVRSRKDADWAIGDYVIDVGSVYDADKNKFDHHQIGGAGQRENGIKYSSLGIVWLKYGIEFCEGNQEIANKIDKKIVEPTDAGDNGQECVKSLYTDVYPYTLYDVLDLYRPRWHEKGKTFDEGFMQALKFAGEVLSKEVEDEKSRILARDKVHEILNTRTDKRLLVMDEYVPIHDDIYEKETELLFVVSPDPSANWAVHTVKIPGEIYKRRKYFPKAWAGGKDKELAETTGVHDAIFCHNDCFIAVAKSKEGALKLAELALANSD